MKPLILGQLYNAVENMDNDEIEGLLFYIENQIAWVLDGERNDQTSENI
uniref:Uncharacterized protein n=1 Tax=Tectiviridae sp. cthzn51 TaxID=2826821 RepID=A0A8S5LUW5_9VIRU|nr:MAG TPA: hypothetical protein [Tectiviridae sp. cthzn51]